MLIQFNFENYKSYFHETSLDLKATGISELSSNLIEYKPNEKYVKVAAIYGANASGKTSVLNAFNHMRYWVLKSFELSGTKKAIPQKRFQFSEEGKNGSSKFEVFFTRQDQEYQYGYLSDDSQVLEEWLYKRSLKSKTRYNLIFERKQQDFRLRNDLKKTADLLDSINERTLMISVLSSLKIEDAINVLNWFEETKVVSFGDVSFEFIVSTSLPKAILDTGERHQRFLEFLKAIDVGIVNIRAEKVEDYDNIMDQNSNERPKYKVLAQHKNTKTGQLEEISLLEESSGTVKMIGLYSFLEEALSEGRTLFVDEMDAKLHPLLSRHILNLFNNTQTNPRGAQLVLTTHDVSSLTNEIFRRDQIWFAEKNAEGISTLYSLAEFKINNTKVRYDATYNKDYLGGRYGAIPYLTAFKVGENYG